MPSSIYLSRGEILNMTITAVGETLDGTWNVGCFARPKCGDPINLNPVVAAGVATVAFDTIDLDSASYQIDIRLTPSGNNDVWSEPFSLFLSDTVTPATPR